MSEKKKSETPKPKTFLLDGKPIEVKEEIITTGERIRYMLVWGANKTKDISSVSDLSKKEKKDLESFYKMVELASIWYQRELNPNMKGITTLVKRMITDILNHLYEKGSVNLEIK